VGDSASVTHAGMKVYLLRVSTLIPKGGGKYELGWKSQRGSVNAQRVSESTPLWSEMASAGTFFEGLWSNKAPQDRTKLFQSCNRYAQKLLAHHKTYAELAGLTHLHVTIGDLEKKAAEAASRPDACVLSIGWGGGLLGKSAYLETEDESYRKILRQTNFYQRAIQTGLPFPKTRKIVFQGNQPASLPGYVLLEVLEK
jgi:CRISPR-associated protein Csm5